MTDQNPASSPVPTPTAPRRRRWPIVALVVGGVLALGGIGAGTAIALTAGRHDEGRHEDTSSSVPAPGSTPATAPSTGAAATGAAAPGDFARARDAAQAAVPGAATTIVREGEGWEVDVRRSDGTDADVRLAAAYSVTRIGGDDDTDGEGPHVGSLAGDSLQRALDAALASAGSAGTLTSIDISDDRDDAYEVQVAQGARTLTVSLAPDFSVVASENDE